MIFLGYNFLEDGYSWQPVPTNLTDITDTTIRNGIYDHFNITKDTSFPYITDLPGEWDLNTQLDADFDGTINAGNIDYVISQISSIRIKKRKKGTFDWYTIDEVPVNKVSDVDFVRYDYLGKQNTEYEYAIVPIIGNTEGEYSMNSIKSSFYGIFLCDKNTSYKFRENVSYNGNQRVRPSALYEPLGGKYPIIVKNGTLNYEQGGVSGDIIVYNDNEGLDREKTIERLNAIKEFLTNDNSKILKDFNGNIWLVAINDNIPINYYSEIGMGYAQLNFNWTEVGDSNSPKDLYDNNLIVSVN